jgi:drug/metabolite transporter (DMT)-like permease
MSTRARDGLAYVYAAGSATAFAGMNFCAHVASAHAHWAVTAAVRSIIGAAVAYGVARARGAATRVRDRRGIWLRSVAGTTSMLLTFYALGTPLSLGDAVTLLNLTPVFLGLLGFALLGERTGRRVWVAVPLCMVGLVLIVRPGVVVGPRGLSGAAAAVGSSISSTFAYALLRRMGRESPEAVALHFSLFAAVVLSLVAVPHVRPVDAATLGWMIGTGFFGGTAQLALTRAYAMERAARVAPIGYLNVVVSALLGALALGEWPSVRAAAGMALIVAGGLVVTLASVVKRTESAV